MGRSKKIASEVILFATKIASKDFLISLRFRGKKKFTINLIYESISNIDETPPLNFVYLQSKLSLN